MVEKLSKNLDLLMSKNCLTANKLASQTGIPASTIKKIRSRVITNPTLATIIPLANFFAVSLEQMVHGDVLAISPASLNMLKQREVKTVPIINWLDAIQWPDIPSNTNCVMVESENSFTSKAFALRVVAEDWRMFQPNGLLLVEPSLQPEHGDFVVTHKMTHSEPTLKEFLSEDESMWLRSINITDNLVRLTDVYRILGVVVEYRKVFKTLMPEEM